MAEPVLVAWSGGKDSALALQEILGAGRYRVAALLTTVTAQYDRISMHGVRRTLLRRQAESLALPLEEDRKSTRSELQSRLHLVCRLLLEKKKKKTDNHDHHNKTTTT